MKIQIFENQDLASEFVAKILAEVPKNSVLGLATGRTPVRIYDYLVKINPDFTTITSFNLDEFVGVEKNDPNSFYTFMNDHLFNKVKFKNTYLPDGINLNCEEYEKLISEHNGIDLQLLGIGGNGHIGFNEPGTKFDSLTSIVDLTNKTRDQYSKPFGNLGLTPSQGITMGIQTIMNTKKIILIAFGEDKAKIIKDALYGEISENIPASILQKHADCLVVLDQAAAKLIHADI